MATTKKLDDFIVNKVASAAVYEAMVQGGLINEDELYLVAGDGDDFRGPTGATGPTGPTAALPTATRTLPASSSII